MKTNCEIIQDIIPLYCDGCASASTCEAVEEHIDECRECRAYATSYRRASRISARPTTREVDIDIDLPYRNLAEKIRIRRRINTACIAGAIIAGAMLLTALLDSKK